MIIDELVLKLQGELTDLKKAFAQVQVDADKTGKAAGEKMGKAAGKGFSEELKKSSNETLKNIETKAADTGSKLTGIFGKIGATIAGVFAVDKIITFFKSAIEEAEKAEEAAGKIGGAASENFKKSQEEIDSSIQKIKEIIGPTLLRIVRFISDAVATILSGIAKVADAIADAFTIKNAEQIAAGYQKTKKEILSMGEELDKLNNTNKRTAEQELELIKLKDQLSEKAKKLGLNYNQLAADSKNYLQIAEKIAKAEREQAKREVGKLGEGLQGGLQQIQQERREAGNALLDARNRGDRDRQIAIRQQLAELAIRERDQKKAIEDTRKRFLNMDAPIAKAEEKKEEQLATGRLPDEARFLDARLRLVTIEENRAYTVRKAMRGRLDEEEKDRRIAMANEEARQASAFELNNLRSVYAQFIEDKAEADRIALEGSKDNAIRAANELLEAQLKLAKDNEDKIQEAKEEHQKRLAKIEETNIKKQEMLRLQSFADTASAANSTVTGFAQIVKAKDIGGGLSGLGATAQGLSKLSPALGALGPVGSIIVSIGSIGSTIAGLFGKSDEDRAREAAAQARRDEEAKKILEEQANYQKSMLALQEAQAKLPFEDLQRQLRLIDIESQQAVLGGGDATTIEAQRLAKRQSALQGTLTSQSGAIAGGQLFGNVGSTPDELIGFLSERGAQSLAIQQFMGLIESLQSDLLLGTDSNGPLVDQKISALRSYKGKVPNALYAVFDQYDRQRQSILSQSAALATADNVQSGRIITGNRELESASAANLNAARAAARGISSEVSADTSIAENLLSTLEQSLANQKSIKDATQKTADNTSKALELRPDRERSFIDIGLGFIQSLGQRVTSPSAVGIAQSLRNFTVPTEIGSASLTASRARTLQERMADAMEIQVAQGARANDLLNGILRATIELYKVMDGNPATASTFDEQAATDFLSDRKRRSY